MEFLALSVIGAFVLGLSLIQCGSVVDSMSFCHEEENAVRKFRPLVLDVLYRDYMHDDAYLIPWLRRSNLNVDEAEKALRKAHIWRQQNKIDTIVLEDYSSFEKELPSFLDGRDREGRPVIEMPFGSKWDVRKQILAGHRTKLPLYVNRIHEAASIKARLGYNKTEAEEVSAKRRDIADFVQIIDMFGYNLRQHACLPCLPTLIQCATDWDSYYPGLTVAYVINIPRIFESVLEVIRSLLADRTNRALRAFGLNKQEWSAELLKNIAPDQLRPSFGGTKML